ncbi:beta-ketoacyl-ACP synthase [Pseudoroseomonas globiformis]|uniref:Beta-ketoacyl-ACP synthase n=1 Tax=Teichococcus globiformis TaxID=2307229 RepID=A0ABV7G1Z4_9PROT
MNQISPIPPLAITALTAVSALGAGLDATRHALRARQGGLAPAAPEDGVPGAWVGRVAGLERAFLPQALSHFTCRNNLLAEMALAQDGFAEAVGDACVRHGPARIGVVLGTSTAGIAETEAAYAARSGPGAPLPGSFNYSDTHDLQALPRYVRTRLGLKGPALAVSTACTSGARTVIEAAALLHSGICDAVVAGGVDTLCRLTLRGFDALALLARGPSRPCAADREGISIGEAAGLFLLERGPAPGQLAILGAGASADGHHMSSPHPEGLGAVTAMRRALQQAGLAPAEIDYINLHGTGTRANDAMEDRAVTEVFGTALPCSSTKGWTGHTLGASGALEVAVAAICLQDGLIPGCLGIDAPDPDFRADLAIANRHASVRRVMSNSFGFGGSNCALVLGPAA